MVRNSFFCLLGGIFTKPACDTRPSSVAAAKYSPVDIQKGPEQLDTVWANSRKSTHKPGGTTWSLSLAGSGNGSLLAHIKLNFGHPGRHIEESSLAT
jgi:hypothetical protein